MSKIHESSINVSGPATSCSMSPGAEYLHAIDNNADYLHIIDDNHSNVSDETGCSGPNHAKSCSATGLQQQVYDPLIQDECAYEEIAGNNPDYLQVAGNNSNYDQSYYNEQNHVPARSTSEASFNVTADSHGLQQVAVNELSHDDKPTDINK